MRKSNRKAIETEVTRHFTTKCAPSRDFTKTFPELADFTADLTFKGIDKTTLKRALADVPDDEISSAITTALKSYELPASTSQVCQKALTLVGRNDKKLNIVWQFAMRSFICVCFRFFDLLGSESDIVDTFHDLFAFAIRYANPKRQARFLVIFDALLRRIIDDWDVFFDKIGEDGRLTFMRVIGECFVVCQLQLAHGDTNGLDILLIQVNKYVSSIATGEIMEIHCEILKVLMTDVLSLIPTLDRDMQIQVSRLATVVLKKCVNFDLTSMQVYGLGVLCLENLREVWSSLTEDLVKVSFESIIEFLVWLTKAFPYERKLEEPPKVTDIEELGPLSMEGYFQYAPTIQDIPDVTDWQNTVFDIVFRICGKSMCEAELTEMMIQKLSVEEEDAKSFYSFAGFLLRLLIRSNDESLLEGFNSRWNVLFSPSFFPLGPDCLYDRSLCNMTSYVIMKGFVHDSKARPRILKAMSVYLNKNGREALSVYFMPLLNSLLLLDKEVGFAMEMIRSPLLSIVVDEAKKRLAMFDFLRVLIYCHPSACFESTLVMSFCWEHVLDEKQRPSIFQCIKSGLIMSHQDGMETEQLEFGLLSRLVGCLNGVIHQDSRMVLDILDLLNDTLSSISETSVDSLMKLNIHKLISNVVESLGTNESFTGIMKFIVNLCKGSKSARKFFSRMDCPIYKSIEVFYRRTDHPPDLIEQTWSVVTVDSTVIQNKAALLILLRWATGRSEEASVYSHLIQLANERTVNIYQLARQEVFNLLINRLKEEISQEIEEFLLNLFRIVIDFTFPDAVRCHTIRLLNEYNKPEKIFNIILDVLSSPSQKQVVSFFHFDDGDSGILIENVVLPRVFTFSTLVRTELTGRHMFLKMLGDGNHTIAWYFEKNQFIGVVDEGPEIVFTEKFVSGRWYDIKISGEGSTISVVIDNLRGATTMPQPEWLAKGVQMVVCGEGFCGDMAELCLLDRNEEDILRCKPVSAEKNLIIGIADGKDAQFSGMAIRRFTSLQDALRSPMMVLELLPLLRRKECQISAFFSIAAEAVQYCQNVLVEHNFFQLLSGYLEQCDYFDESLLAFYQTIYMSVLVTDFGIAMVEYLLLDLEIIDRLTDRLKVSYFDTFLPQLLTKRSECFIAAKCFTNLLYRATDKFLDSSPLSVAVWGFISMLGSMRTSISDMESLALIPVSVDNERALSATMMVLDHMLLTKKDILKEILEIHSYTGPFIRLIGHSSHSIQVLALKMINNIATQFEYDVTPTVMMLVQEYKQSDSPKTVASYLFESIITDTHDGKIRFCALKYLPLLVTMCSGLEKEATLNMYNKFMSVLFDAGTDLLPITDVDGWHWWLMRWIACYMPTTDVDSFVLPIATIMHICGFENLMEVTAEVLCSAIKIGLNVNQYLDMLTKSIISRYLVEKDVAVSHDLLKLIFISEVFDIYVDYAPIPHMASILDELNAGTKHNATIGCQMYTPMDGPTHLTFQRMEEPIWSYFSRAGTATIDLDQHSVSVVVLSSYLLCLSMQRKSHLVNQFYQDILQKLPKLHDEDAYLAASLILATNRSLGCPDSDFEQLGQYYTLFDDLYDSAELAKFRFEEDIIYRVQSVANAWTVFGGNLNSRISECLKQLRYYADGPSEIDLICQKIQVDFDFGKATVLKMLQNKAKDRERLLHGFENEMKTIGGPWHDSFLELHFKALNRISIHGRRILMSLNHHFTRHEEAVRARDERLCGSEEMPESQPVLKAIAFDTAEGEAERFRSSVTLITVVHEYEGILTLTATHLLFQGSHKGKSKNFKVPIDDIVFIMKHTTVREDNGAELHMVTGKAILFVFRDQTRSLFFRTISRLAPKWPTPSPTKFRFFHQLREISGLVQRFPAAQLYAKLQLCAKWQSRAISNYEYLYCLNMLAGRSFNDISQYPVFPIILTNTPELDLKNIECYRDLSCPVGLLRNTRESLLEQYNEIEDEQDKCMYHTFFSSSILVCNILIRVEPFTSLHIAFQDRKFDHASRLFSNIRKFTEFTPTHRGDVREMIPEFYTFPYFLLNSDRFNFGEGVDNVELPEWASSPYHYIEMNRRALESDLVSSRLNKWIDLVFGIKRRSLDDCNIFHPFNYPETKVDSLEKRKQMETHALNFGLYPYQVFSSLHPERGEREPSAKDSIRISQNGLIVAVRKQFVATSDRVLIDTTTNEKIDTGMKSFGDWIFVSRSLNLLISASSTESVFDVFSIADRKCKVVEHEYTPIQCMCVAGGVYMVTGSTDNLIRIWSLASLTMLRSSSYHMNTIIAVAANCEVGLVVSIDCDFVVIFELLLEDMFIRRVVLPKVETTPLIAIFKSGRTVITTTEDDHSVVKVFSVKGDILGSISLPGTAKSIEKFYDFDTRELLLVGVEPRQIILIDLSKLEIMKTINGSFHEFHFSTIKGRRSILVAMGPVAQSIDFDMAN